MTNGKMASVIGSYTSVNGTDTAQLLAGVAISQTYIPVLYVHI